MKTGKASENVIKRSVLKTISERNSILEGAVRTEDCALFTGYVTGEARPEAGAHAVIRAVNRAAEAGQIPYKASLSVTIPVHMREKRLREIVSSAADTAVKYGIAIETGHTESVEELKTPVISVVLACMQDPVCRTDVSVTDKLRAKPGQSVVMTKWLGLYGSALIAAEHGEGLRDRFPDFIIDRSIELWDHICIRDEADIAHGMGVTSMYACGDGGVYAGLWKLADRSGTGISVQLKSIPVKQETIELCEYYNINPYRLRCDGALLMAADKPEELIAALEDKGINAVEIGCITESRDRVVVSGDERRYLEEPTQDELCTILWYNKPSGGRFIPPARVGYE